jgi:hypothetical protein
MITTAPDENAKLEFAFLQRSQGGPAWRWNRAGEEIHRRPSPHLRACGEDVVNLHHYRTLCDHSSVGIKQALALYPQIALAEELNAHTFKTGLLKVAVLGEIDLPAVCQQLNLDVAVADAWEKSQTARFGEISAQRTKLSW